MIIDARLINRHIRFPNADHKKAVPGATLIISITMDANESLSTAKRW
jgi:hypothetical protein